MLTAGIKDIKNHLSRYLNRVKAGEEVIITARGKPVARIIQEKQRERSMASVLATLVARGLITLPTREIAKQSGPPVSLEGRDVSDMVLESRR
ncbi:MAG: type II toxin-antitoxin system prevent-host-death family antitoxin [Desulfohalobiaceae bacterium]|nr:type II toxin-antitoxin system prevent-host-death family antitoxin [Desulfohalobiaceae bacterium]